VYYIDFNDEPMFEPEDFMDTDHMSETGAKKVSGILADIYGR